MKPQPPFASPLEASYWGPPAVTPEREDAWRRWVDDYTFATALGWVEDGESEDAAIGAMQKVLDDWAEIDELEWMPSGLALVAANVSPWASRALDGTIKPLEGDARTEFMNGTRTAVTSSRHERTECIAYQLGITMQQAQNVVAQVRADYEPDADGERTALYRYFDHGGFLLYVGITKSTDARDEQHARASRWYKLQAHQTVEWFDDRATAHLAERVAIENELPLFNTTHADADSKRRTIDYLIGRVEASA